MNISSKILWNSVQNLALLGFLFCLSLTLRDVLWTFPPEHGFFGFNEYTDVSFYISDLALAFFVLTTILSNKSSVLSTLEWKRMFHVEHMAYLLLLPWSLVGWSLLTTFWSENQTLSIYGSFKLFEGVTLYTVLLFLFVPRGTFSGSHKCSTWNIRLQKENIGENPVEIASIIKNVTYVTFFRFLSICSTWNISRTFSQILPKKRFIGEKKSLPIVPRGTLICETNCSTWNNWQVVIIGIITISFTQAIISLIQFFLQGSIGLSGHLESKLSPFLPGIAKISLGENLFIRGYGLFPHPNILGAFLAMGTLLTLFIPLFFL